MRKSAPALIFTTLIAFASGSAMALGDRAKDKKAHTDAATTSQSSTSASSTPSATTNGSAGSIDMDKKKKDGKCDPSKYTDKSTMPAECAEKTSPGGSSPSGAGGSSGSTGGGAAGGSGSGSGTK